MADQERIADATRPSILLRSRIAGLTLVELVMAIVVLGIAVPPVLVAFAEAPRDAVEAERQNLAGLLAIDKMEMILADRHSANRGYSYLDAANYLDETPISGYANYDRTVTITEVDPSDFTTANPGSGYKRITVRVTYTDLSRYYEMSNVVCDLSS